MAGDKPSLGYVAPYLMRDEQLLSALEAARNTLKEFEAEQINRAKWPPEMRLAMKLHDRLCQSRDCDFYYQFEKDGIRDMTGIAAEPPRYRRMAELIQHYCETYKCPLDQLLEVISLRKP